MGRNYSFEDLTGGLNTVSSIGTINQSARRTESPDMENVEYFYLGGVRSMEGNTQIGATQASAVVGGFEYVQGGNKFMVIALRDGTIRLYNGATEQYEEIYEFDTVANRVSFCNINDGIVFTNGIDDPVYYKRGRYEIVQGTVTATKGSTTLTGSGTKFETELAIGNSLDIEGNIYYVESIESDTSLTLETEAIADASDVSAYISEISKCNAYLVNEDDPNLHTPIRGTAIQYFKGRLWIGSGSTIYYSQLGQYNKWDTKYEAGAIGDFYNDTSDVTALGLFSSYLMIHKEYSTYILSGGDNPDDWSVDPYSEKTCLSQQSWGVTNSKYFVFSRDDMGIFPLNQVTIFQDKYIGNEMSIKIHNLFDQLRLEDLDQVFIVTHPSKRWIIFYMPFYQSEGSGKAVIYDFQTNSWLIRNLPQNVTIAFEYDSDIYIGTEDGLVLREFSGKTFNGAFLSAYWKSPWFSFGEDYAKTFDEFTLKMSQEENNTFMVRGYRDGEAKFFERQITNELADGNALIWDSQEPDPANETTWDNQNWIKSKFESPRFPLELNYFEHYQIEFRTAVLNQGFALYGFAFRRTEYDEVRW